MIEPSIDWLPLRLQLQVHLPLPQHPSRAQAPERLVMRGRSGGDCFEYEGLVNILDKEKEVNCIASWNDCSPSNNWRITEWYSEPLATHLHFRSLPRWSICKIGSVLFRIIGFSDFCMHWR